MLRATAIILLIGLVSTGHARSPDKALQECQKLKDRVAELDALRRGGGSAAQMDAWKRARRSLEKRFRASGCRRLRHRLE